jgi:hypothetical protein
MERQLAKYSWTCFDYSLIYPRHMPVKSQTRQSYFRQLFSSSIKEALRKERVIEPIMKSNNTPCQTGSSHIIMYE